MHKFLFVTFGLFLFSNLYAQSLSQLDDSKSPKEKFESGLQFEGVFNINNTLYCSHLAARSLGVRFFNDNEFLNVNTRQIQVSELTKMYSSPIENVLNILSQNNDLKVKGRHLCLGFYTEKNSLIGNAATKEDGYVLIDTRLVTFLYNLPENKRSQYIFSFVELHEFAHQLQYWNNDFWVYAPRKKLLSNVRHSELAADCISAALHSYQWKNYSEQLKLISKAGLLGAAEALADQEIDSYDHHGQANERQIAVEMGFNIGIKYSGKLNSKELLDSCNSAISYKDIADGAGNWK